jgi:hypothetical protein
VKDLDSFKSSSVSVKVVLKSGDLLCEIRGVGDELGMRIDEPLLLDFSQSYDSNVGSGKTEIRFNLHCFQLIPVYRETCQYLNFSSQSYSKVVVQVDDRASNVKVGDVFQLIVNGKSSQLSDQRQCERKIRLTILGSLSPVISLNILSGLSMNPSSKLKIVGEVNVKSNESQLFVDWNVNDPFLYLSSFSLSPLNPNSSSSLGTSTKKYVISLVLIGVVFSITNLTLSL